MTAMQERFETGEQTVVTVHDAGREVKIEIDAVEADLVEATIVEVVDGEGTDDLRGAECRIEQRDVAAYFLLNQHGFWMLVGTVSV